MRAIILARVSTLKQEKEGLSLKDIQLPELRDYADKNGFEVVREFVFSKAKSEFHGSLLNRYQADYQKYENRIERMYEDKLDGIITEGDYEKRRKE